MVLFLVGFVSSFTTICMCLCQCLFEKKKQKRKDWIVVVFLSESFVTLTTHSIHLFLPLALALALCVCVFGHCLLRSFIDLFLEIACFSSASIFSFSFARVPCENIFTNSATVWSRLKMIWKKINWKWFPELGPQHLWPPVHFGLRF